MKDEWYDTLNTDQRQIIDLRRMGLRHAVSFGCFRYDQAAPPLGRQQHSSWLVLIFVIEGSQHYRIDGQDLVVRGGHWLSVPPGTSYGTGEWPEQRGKTAWLILDQPFETRKARLGLSAEAANQVMAQLLSIDPLASLPSPEGMPERIEAIFAGLPIEDEILEREHIRTCLARILLGAAIESKRDRRGMAGSAAVREVVRRIEQSRELMLDLDELIADSGVPTVRFYRDFKEITGTTPGDYITQVRLEHAARILIENEGKAVTEIAHDLGFSSSQYFATAFRRHFGTTPSQWRQDRGMTAGARPKRQ